MCKLKTVNKNDSIQINMYALNGDDLLEDGTHTQKQQENRFFALIFQ